MRTGRARGPTSNNRRSQGVRAKPTSRSPTEIDKLVGTNVRRVRLERGLTLSDLGEQLGISHQQLQKYETGMPGPVTATCRSRTRASAWTCFT